MQISPLSNIYRHHYWKNPGLLHIKSMGHQQVLENYRWSCHNRQDAFYIFQYTLSGAGQFSQDGRNFSLPPHTAFLAKVPSDSAYFLPPKTTHWEFFYLEIKNLPSVLEEVLLEESQHFFDFSMQPPTFLHKLEIIFQEMKQRQFSPYENSSKTYELLMMMLQTLHTKDQEYHEDKQKLVQKIIHYFEVHYHEDLSLDQLAEQFNKSKYQLIRLFKTQQQQQTPMEVLAHIRIIKAQELLLNDASLTIQAIAQLCGFQSANYFSKVFKKNLNKTPLEYREKFIHFKNQTNYFD